MATKVLVTGAGGPAAVSFMRAVQGEDFELYACDVDPYAAGLYLVPEDRRALIHRADHPALVHDLITLCTQHRIDVLVPTVDAELIRIVRARGAFERLGVRIMIASEQTLMTCLDKLELARACKNIVRVPRTEPLTASFRSDNWQFPVIVKPRRGSGSRGVVLVTSAQELASYVGTPDLIVQELLPGAEYSVDVLASVDGHVVAAVPRERLKVDSGIAVTSRVVKDVELEDLAKQVAQIIGLTGVANVQLRRDAKGRPALLEVNPRIPGTMPLTVAAGVNMPLLALQNLLGKALPDRCLYREIAVVRTWSETFFEPGELIAMEYEQTAREANEEPIFARANLHPN